jgi:integrase
VRLTDAAIKALKPRENVYDVYDDDVKCFGVRVTPAGVKSFTFFYRLGDRRKKKRINLGEYPHVTLADARQTAREARGVVKGERRHPEINKAPAQQSAEPLTIERLADLYLASDKFKAGREATRDQFRRVIDGQIKPALGARPLVSITPADLVDWSQGIIDRGAPVTANQSFKILRLVWNWGRKRLVRENVPVFPLAGFGKPWDGERPRKRHLPPQLFGKFVKAVTEEPRLTAVWWLLMLLNLTRKTETCLLEKSEIVWKSERGAYLIIPGEKAKNHQPLFQPLTRYSEHLLRLALKHSGDSRWVMPGRKPRTALPDRQRSAKDEDVPRFQRTGVPATRVSRRIGAAVSPHDLRHTVATILGELGVEPHVIDAVQNHKLPQSTAVTGTYNDALVWAYFQHKHDALLRWHEHLDRKLLGGKLLQLIRRSVDGKKKYEEAMKRNMKLGPHSEAHRLAVRRRANKRRPAAAADRVSAGTDRA